jgi:hypothetical protein
MSSLLIREGASPTIRRWRNVAWITGACGVLFDGAVGVIWIPLALSPLWFIPGAATLLVGLSLLWLTGLLGRRHEVRTGG